MDTSTTKQPSYGWSDAAYGSGDEDEELENYSKSQLKSKIFVGHYQERRHVDKISDYRDLIVLPDSECDIIRTFQNVAKRLDDHFKQQKWIGMTDKHVVGAPAGFCVWTELDNVAFGSYWFEVRSVRFRDKEVLVRLKMIRPFVEATGDSSGSTAPPGASDFAELLTAKKNGFLTFWYDFIATGVTTENTISGLKFMCLLVVAFLHGSVEFIKFLGYFSIRFMHEFNRLIHVCTPLLLGIMDIGSKIVGGFFILIAMFFRGGRPINRGPPPRHQPIGYYDRATYERRAIKHYDDGDY